MANKAHTISIALLLILSFSSCKADNNSTNTEAKALLKWKSSLPPNQPILDSWDSSLSPCEWRGIVCNQDQSVTRVNLSSTGLRGTLEDLDFSSFPSLLSLDLTFNHLTGPVPASIGSASSLAFLDLSTNSLTGSLPLSLANLTDLYELDVSRNGVSGVLDPRLFPNSSYGSGLLSLKRLLFQDTRLGGKIPEEIGNLKRLTLLAIDGCYFHGAIPESLANLTELTALLLDMNRLSGEIPSRLASLRKLSDLRLYMNELSGTVPAGLGNASELTVLHLAYNNLTGVLPPLVCRGEKLVNFSAAYNGFVGPVPASLRNCSSLFRVRLEHNALTGDVGRDFGGVYPNLNYIDLSFNRLRGRFSPSLAGWRNLNLLNAAGNSITGKIPDEIFGLNGLVELDLSSNELFGEIPRSIGNSSSLSFLSLKNNRLTGKIPEEIGRLLNLASLDLSQNLLTGQIPIPIGECSKLQHLSLSKNQLNGSIPGQIGNLVALQDLLDLSYNSLTGETPPNLGKLAKLEILNLSHNSLSGSIPVSLGNMLSLSYIDLSHNNLEGSVPRIKIFDKPRSANLTGNENLCGDTTITGLPLCKSAQIEEKKPHHVKTILIASLSSLVAVALLLVAVSAFFRRKEPNAKRVPSRENPFSVFYFDGKLVYRDIIEATNNFDDKYCIGAGGSGKVYKATIPSHNGDENRVYAVKKLSLKASNSAQIESIKSFANEVAALTEIKHRNIVKLYGFCSDAAAHTFLVYRYVERGSLEGVLGDDDMAAEELGWEKRIGVVSGVARALCYLHHECSPPIVHRDISSKNVLLDSELEARVSDFGTAKILKPGSVSWTAVGGTFGYMAPELAYNMAVTQKSDVYSFGVLTLEVLMENTLASSSQLFNQLKLFMEPSQISEINSTLLSRFR